MKYFDWDDKKNSQLIQERGVNFEEVLIAVEGGYLLVVVEHPNKAKYPNQRIFIVRIEDYVYLVPFTEDGEKILLKTVIPSRKATKKYLKNK